ncbi:MAG TPA: hypothetical protein VGO46_19220 [Gemmatimonadaceae bacterium]|jgi:hypothetical protein|nr:hypothetical protein [Gemmatimonadaceae bacterium]
MSRISRWSFTMLAVVVALSAPATSSAQFGGLKKKLKDKVTGDTPPAPTTAAAPATGSAGDPDAKARRDAWQHPVPITSATLDGFVKAIKAENAERAKYVASAAPTSAIGKWNAYQQAKDKCARDQVLDDSTQARLQRKMMAEATAGHGENIQAYTDSMTKLGQASQARSQQCNALARPQFSDDEWKEVRAEENKEEAAAAAVAGIDPLVYSRLKERVIAYTLMPSSWTPSGYSPAELAAIDARKAEIKPLLGKDFNTSGQRTSLGS